jgi:hypothetical protein
MLISIGSEAKSSIQKISEEYGDMGLYETFRLQAKGDRCTFVILHGDTIIDTSCRKMTNSKGKKIYCTKRKKICKLESELLGKKPPKKAKRTQRSSSGYKHDLAVLEKSCRKGEKMDCYAAKRYKIFKRACDKGDRHSCKVLSNLRKYRKQYEAGDILAAQDFHWSINNEKSSAGK